MAGRGKKPTAGAGERISRAPAFIAPLARVINKLAEKASAQQGVAPIRVTDSAGNQLVELDLPALVALIVANATFSDYVYDTAYSAAFDRMTADGVFTDLADHEARLATAETDLAAAEADIVTLQTDLAAAEADIATLQTDLAAAEADIATLQTDLAAAEVDIVAAQADADAANAYIATIVEEAVGTCDPGGTLTVLTV